MRILTLPLKGIYFDQIADGEKPFEYRLMTPYWRKRLEGRVYDGIELTKGYPASGCVAQNAQTVAWVRGANDHAPALRP